MKSVVLLLWMLLGAAMAMEASSSSASTSSDALLLLLRSAPGATTAVGASPPTDKAIENPETRMHNENALLDRILYGSASLSVVGSLFIVITYLTFTDYRSFGTKLVFFLSLSDLLTALGWYPWNVTEVLCQIQASIIQFASLASYGWSFAIAFCLFVLFYVDNVTEAGIKKMMPLIHIVIWGYSLVTTILCLTLGKFGRAGSWCWISDPRDPFRLFVYAPMLVLVVVISALFIAVRVRLKRMGGHMTKDLQNRLSLYLLAFVVSQLPAVINRIQNFVDPGHPQVWLFGLQAFFQPLQGLLNAIVYGFNDMFYEQWRRTFSRTCGRNRCMRRCCAPCFYARESYPIGGGVLATNDSGTDVPVYDYDYSSDD